MQERCQSAGGGFLAEQRAFVGAALAAKLMVDQSAVLLVTHISQLRGLRRSHIHSCRFAAVILTNRLQSRNGKPMQMRQQSL